MQEPDAATVAEALARVYARSEFRERRPPTFLERIWEQLGAAFLDALDWMVDRIPFPEPGTQTLIAWIAAALLATGIVFLLLRLRSRTASGRARPDAGAGAISMRMRDAAEWERIAAEAAGARQYRDAALALYRAVLLHLAERGAIHLREGKTPGDYQRELSGRSGLEEGFRGFVRLLLPLAWGSSGATPEGYDELELAARRVGDHERPA